MEAMQEEAARAADPIDFSHPADLAKHTGFLPVRVQGRDTGFEYYFDAVPDGALLPEALAFGSHHIITRTGSDFEEGRAALTFLKVAARLTGGAYVYPDDGIIVPPEDVQSYLDEQIEQYGKYVK
jgi:hypothetical protein